MLTDNLKSGRFKKCASVTMPYTFLDASIGSAVVLKIECKKEVKAIVMQLHGRALLVH